ncbi:hypothetical protein JHK87_027912 [Glycine soja]|nr:hypothetical protein JHK87_027912 [Glycine soja]
MQRPDRDIFSSHSEQTTSTEGLVLEEFIPIKKRASSSSPFCEEEDEDDEQHSHKQRVSKENNNSDMRKLDWLRFVQLWNPDPLAEEELEKKRKEKAQLVYERKKKLNKLRVKVE